MRYEGCWRVGSERIRKGSLLRLTVRIRSLSGIRFQLLEESNEHKTTPVFGGYCAVAHVRGGQQYPLEVLRGIPHNSAAQT